MVCQSACISFVQYTIHYRSLDIKLLSSLASRFLRDWRWSKIVPILANRVSAFGSNADMPIRVPVPSIRLGIHTVCEHASIRIEMYIAVISVDRETIKQAVTAGALQITLAAATRTMRTIPGTRIRTATRAIVMAHLCATVGSVVGPVSAGMVFISRERSTVQI